MIQSRIARHALVFTLLIASCAGAPAKPEPASPAQTLAQWMTGAFSSREQARLDEEYFEISLVVVPIWTDRAGGPWLYVEQAVATALDQPYRQRVYRLVDLDGGEVRSDIYELLGDPLTLAGAWRDPQRFDAVQRDGLARREGCSVFLRRAGDAFTGSTQGTGCASSLRGAAYATSEVVVGPDRLVSWDRGFDRDGTQVWGAVSGGYFFDRIELP